MPEFEDMDTATLRRVLVLVHEHTGVTMAEAKKAMLQSRLRPHLRRLKLGRYGDYVAVVQGDETERRRFIDSVTTHQTSFFRTPKVWQYFSEQFLPAWAAAHGTRPLRLWSAAASTGEEACTAAICCEEFRRQRPALRWELMGTDISAEVLAQARAGDYEGRAVAAFRAAQPELFDRYNAAGSAQRFRLADAPRSRISFAVHHLLQACPWPQRFDLVFLRNVLIYFKPDDVLRVLRHVAEGLRPQGVLVIGESESLTALDVPFEFILPQVYRRA